MKAKRKAVGNIRFCTTNGTKITSFKIGKEKEKQKMIWIRFSFPNTKNERLGNYYEPRSPKSHHR